MRASLAVVLVLGCGGDDAGALPDAAADASGSSDASIDADPGTSVMVTITEGGVPAAGVTVYFQDASSSTVATVITLLDGAARAEVPAGGFVTVVEPRPIVGPSASGVVVIRDRLSTFAGVKPGDALHLDLRPATDATEIVLHVQVPEDPGAESYEVFTSCGRALLPMDAALMPAPISIGHCSGSADLLVASTELGTPRFRALYRANQPVTDGATITLTEPYQDFVPVTVSMIGTPAWVASYFVELDLVGPRGRVYPAFATLDPATPSAVLPMPVAAGTTGFLRADIFPAQPAASRQSVLAWGLPIADLALDVGALAVRPFATAPVFDPATRSVTWTEGAGRAPDLVRAEVYTYRDGDPAHAWHWQLVAPYGGPSVTFPALPAEAAAAFTPLATDSSSVPGLEAVAIEGGYDQLRPHALRTTLDTLPAGAPGRLTYQRLADPELIVPPTVRPPVTFTRATR